MFKKYGRCHVIVMSSLLRRGQAWIVFESVNDATQAQSATHGQVGFGKKLRVSFSKNLSDLTRERKGLPPREKVVKPRRVIQNPEGDASSATGQSAQDVEEFFKTSAAAPKVPSTRGYNPPNKVLMIEELPPTMSESDLSSLFRPLRGFVEIRMIPSRGVAFAEFENDMHSQAALSQVSEFGVPFRMSFAKR
jgi:RNA recognition motif-containing protein